MHAFEQQRRQRFGSPKACPRVMPILIVTTTCLTYLPSAFAAPAVTGVSGTPSGGSSLTLTGTGFGTHADWGDSQPFLNKAWHNFETGSFEGGNIQMGDYPQGWRMMTTGNRANSSYYAERFCKDDQEERGSLEVTQSGGPTEYYVSFWFKMAPTNQQSGKFFRIWAADGHNIFYSTGGDDTQIRASCEGCTGGTQWSSKSEFGLGVWRRFELYMNTKVSANRPYIDGVEQWSRPDLADATPWVGDGHTIDIGHMMDNSQRRPLELSNGWYDYDDVYIDHTQARVELCTGSSWSSRGTCELQIPTAWSNASISVLFNRGAFASGGTAYLYVVDKTGAYNTNGFALKIGTASSSPPAAPTGLKVN